VDNEEYGLLKIVSAAIREMVEGELLQIQKSRTLNITQEEYFEIIRKKTAVLIAACTTSGTKSVCDDEEVISKMHLFGENVGIAFQIKDDIFDFQQEGKTGKPAGMDIKEKKLTLPLIYSLENTSKSNKRNILRMIEKHNKKSKTIKEVIDFVTQNKGIEYACEKMAEYKNQALKILSEFSGNAAKTSLIELVNYSTIRER
jgi:octaprenyl-diphosphate synthase